jgi:hypothetical protein
MSAMRWRIRVEWELPRDLQCDAGTAEKVGEPRAPARKGNVKGMEKDPSSRTSDDGSFSVAVREAWFASA